MENYLDFEKLVHVIQHGLQGFRWLEWNQTIYLLVGDKSLEQCKDDFIRTYFMGRISITERKKDKNEQKEYSSHFLRSYKIHYRSKNSNLM